MLPEPQPARPGAGPTQRWDAIIVAGGRARRLGGIDKTALVWQGRSLLDGVVAAADGARKICVVGSEAELPASVLRAVERPRWGGPAAAIVAGLEALAADADPGCDKTTDTTAENAADKTIDTAADTSAEKTADWVVLLAGDLVRAADAVTMLLAELERVLSAPRFGAEKHVVDGLISVDGDGRRQPLLAVYRRSALTSAAGMQTTVENMSVTGLIGRLNLVELHVPAALSDDIDTPADAARLGIILPASATPPATPPQPTP